jgi:subtilisin-like proprotein convertase family protein
MGVGNVITVFAVARDTAGNFVANVAAVSWSLVNVSGGVASGDLVPSGDQKSAYFTGHLTGSAMIHASCPGISALNSGTVTVLQNPPPVISPIADQTTLVGISVGPFPISIRDPATNVDSLTLTGTSSDQTLVPDENINIFNRYGLQTLFVTPAAGLTGTAWITISASDGAGSNSVSFLLTVNPPGGGTAVFGNPSTITIPQVGPATNYPATITVAGLAGTITDLTVTLHDMSHTYPGDVDMLLVGPTGQGVVLFSMVAVGLYPMSDVTFSLSDDAYYPLPCCSDLPAGTYKPTDNASDHTNAPHIFPAPAPTAPFATTLGAFNGSSPNGTWSLYVLDTQSPDAGEITGGWSMAITTVPSAARFANLPPTILSLTGSGTTNVVISWSSISNLTYQVQYRSGLALTNWVPLEPNVTASNTVASAVDNPTGDSQRFYRILVMP